MNSRDLGEVELAEVAARFGHLLRAAGVPVTLSAAARFADALALGRPQRTDELYWLARVTLVHDRAHFDAFRAVFDQLFSGLLDAYGTQRNPHGAVAGGTRQRDATLASRSERPSAAGGGAPPSSGVESDGASGDSDAVLAAVSAHEALRHRSFAHCTPEELDRVRALIGALRLSPPMRRSRRTVPRGGRGTLDLRATVRAARRTGGEPFRRRYRRRRERRRRVVLVADVSGSMEPYARAYLSLLHSAVRAVGAEAFVFSTRLHRLTRQLSLHNPDHALLHAVAATPDWSSGTRIGAALRAFNDQHARRGVSRGAIVVIVSDGWESDDAALVAREMERLSLLAHRIVWVNPRKQRADYQPLAGGMAAALPFVDVFLSGHSLAALDAVVEAIASA